MATITRRFSCCDCGKPFAVTLDEKAGIDYLVQCPRCGHHVNLSKCPER